VAVVPACGDVEAECALPAATGSIATARHWITAEARTRGADARTVSAMELVTSELVANAVHHAAGTSTIRLVVRSGSRGLEVRVHDSSTGVPRLRSDRAGLPGGHGLYIVDRLSGAWGWQPASDGGKVVWASFDRS
jgi:anti-sigma regulatory factor (Ser/Thr protein kinase)